MEKLDLNDPNKVENYLASKAVAPRITLEMVEANIVAEHYFTGYEARMGAIVERHYHSIGSEAGSDKDLNALRCMTFCVLVLKNGFTVTGQSACASPENFMRDFGQELARRNAVSQIWPLMAYELKTKLEHQEQMDAHGGDPLGTALTMLLATSLGNDKALQSHHAKTILQELIPVNVESNERLARMCHSANKSWCEMGGDFSQPDWGDLPQANRDGMISAVAFLRANPDAGDEAMHEQWCRARFADGWIYGPQLDRLAKIHPNLVPFDQLPEEQQFKDKLFRSIVLASLKNPTDSNHTSHLSVVR